MVDTIERDYTIDASGSVALRYRKTQFGDGYEQRTPDGINPKTTSWTVTFTFPSVAEVQNFTEVLDDAAGSYVFWQSPMDEAPQAYTIEQYDIRFEGRFRADLSVTFQSWNGT